MLVLVAGGLAAIAVPGAAARPPALDQYVPSLPGASGSGAPRLTAPARPAALPAALRARLARQPDGPLLLRIATAPGLGAPRAARTRRAPGGGRVAAAAPPNGSAAGAARDALHEPAVLALLAGMLLSAGVLLVLARMQRRRV